MVTEQDIKNKRIEFNNAQKVLNTLSSELQNLQIDFDNQNLLNN